MGAVLVTGSAYGLRARLAEDMRSVLRDGGDAPVLLLVPGQLTLETERLALESARLPGSFRLQVLSPARLYDRVFEQAGRSEASRVDERGRAVLMRRALDEWDGTLLSYEGARRSAGFAALAAETVLQWKGAGCGPEDIRRLAQKREGTPLGRKLADIAQLSELYAASADGLAMDEEDARREAIARLAEAPLFHGALVWVSGFDLLTNPVSETVAALCGVAGRVTVLFPLQDGPDARDSRLYAPARRTYDRAAAMLRAAGVSVSHETAAEPRRRPCAPRALERELFAYPVRPEEAPRGGIALHAARSPRAEAEHAAAAVRQLVRTRGWRYRDIAVACQDSGALYSPLQRAFALYGIPVFFPESRMALAHPLCAALLAAVRMAAGPVREADAQTLLGSGYSPLEDDEADLARNFAFEHGVTSSRWLRPWLPGEDPDGLHAAFEERRSRFAAPVLRLREGLRRGDTRARLESVVAWLEETDAYGRMLAQSDALLAAEQPVAAAEGPQVWGKLLSALDQIALVYGKAGRPLSGRVLAEMLGQALSATEVKPLPQSADAVSVGTLEHMKTRPVRAVIIVGTTDRDEGEEPTLLPDADRAALGEEVWLGPDRRERACMRLLAAKEAVSFAEEAALVSWHTSASDGSVRRPGALVRSIQSVFPGLSVSGGLQEDEGSEALRLYAPDPALALLAEALRGSEALSEGERAALATLATFPERRPGLAAFRDALQGDIPPGQIEPRLARQLYDGPRRLSVTRLEQFARCPFSHFVRYGARPEELREWGIDPRDAGSICHDALDRFLQLHPERQDADTAVRHMDAITEQVLEKYLPGLRAESAVSRAEAEGLRRVARRAALTYLRQTEASSFVPAAAEAFFGGETGLPVGDALLEGRIDRIDVWRAAGEDYFRVIDYKRGGKELRLALVYYGLQLQLMVYLAAAQAMLRGQPAAALYFTVADPLVRTRSEDPEEIEAARRKELRLDGAVLSEEDVVRALSDPPQESLPVSFTADGSLRASDKLLTREEFALLMGRALERAEDAFAQMQAGDIAASPARLGNETKRCAYCPYAAVCRRDAYTDALRERLLPAISPQEVLERLRA